MTKDEIRLLGELSRVRSERDEARLQAARWRKDGWPICPTCDEDELYCLSVPATAAKIDGCYRCGSSFDPPKDFTRGA